MATHTAPTEEDLWSITVQMWESYLDPDGGRPLLQVPVTGVATDVSAAVSVTGSWNGHVVVECSMTASREVAAAMLGIDPPGVSDSDMADALGEMANVIGGSVKSLLPGECALSLPHVVASPGASRVWPSVSEVCRLQASWLGEPILVMVLESAKELAEA